MKREPEEYRSPWISAAAVAFWGFATTTLYAWGEKGLGIAPLGCLVTGVFAFQNIVRGWDDFDRWKRYRAQEKRFKQVAAEHGDARFGTAADVDASKYFSRNRGVFLGTQSLRRGKTQDVFFDGEGSISVIAMPGQQKTMSIVVTSLLHLALTARRNHRIENLILNDISGELYSICAAALERAGYKIVLVCPFANSLSEILDKDVEDSGLDVFSSFTPDMDGRQIRSKLLAIMKWIMPDKPGMDEQSRYFLKYGRMIGGFLALHEMAEGRKPNLPAIRGHLMLGATHIYELFQAAETSEAFAGVYGELARTLAGMRATAPLQFAGGFGNAEMAFDLFDPMSSLGQHTIDSDFDPRILKDENQKVAVFVVYTLEQMKTHASALAMTMTYLLDTAAATQGSALVTAYLDEVGLLQMPLAEMLDFYRKANVRCVMIWQDLKGQAEKKHGQADLKSILAASQFKIAMGIGEPETLSMFSTLCGTRSFVDRSMNDRGGDQSDAFGQSSGMNHRGVPLMRTEQIRTLPDDQLLVVGGNVQPLILNKLPYWKRSIWRRIAGLSPFYKG
jgi:type IV secretory pathway TraG/TraD family ATPase VirD4